MLTKKLAPGMETSVRKAMLDINLDNVVMKLIDKHGVYKWPKKRAQKAVNLYKEVLIQLLLAFKGCGIVSASEEDPFIVLYLHVQQPEYSSQMKLVVELVAPFIGADMETIIPLHEISKLPPTPTE